LAGLAAQEDELVGASREATCQPGVDSRHEGIDGRAHLARQQGELTLGDAREADPPRHPIGDQPA